MGKETPKGQMPTKLNLSCRLILDMPPGWPTRVWRGSNRMGRKDKHMAEVKSLPRFEMSKQDEAQLETICRKVQADYAGEWSQSKTAVAVMRAMETHGLKITPEVKAWLLPLLSKGSNSSALRQAVFEKKTAKATLAADYGGIV